MKNRSGRNIHYTKTDMIDDDDLLRGFDKNMENQTEKSTNK
jgi:hypothetical protein